MSTIPTLKDVFSGWDSTGGIFNILEDVGDMPWEDADFVDTGILDIEYFGNHSGLKLCSPLVEKFASSGSVSTEDRTKLAKIIISRFLPGWNHLWEVNDIEYSPIHNYDMTEERTTKRATSEVESIVDTHTGTDTTAYGRTEGTEYEHESTELSSKYGINTDTESPKPSDLVETSEDSGTTVESGGEDVETKDLTDNRGRNNVGAEEETEGLRRYGNIGVTTTQQMIQSERNLWLWDYFTRVFEDVDKVLTIPFYDPCRS